ncbi:M16 family metallopeptidase [Pontivivens nitratireducens]|uniref:M16 family metallopeptidase n=1 Tax=Pontivivens nitratireducens TaxID=2758038 RepID=UPI00163B22C1|nr:pitrilysin family protein [Pontibrevibacter nitratireducens]
MIRYALAALLALIHQSAAAQTEIEQVVTPAGITFWLSQETSIPIVSVKILFRGGTALDPDDRPGAATMMTGLLNEGAGDMDALAYAAASEEVAARIGFDVGRDTLSVSATMLREVRAEVVDLVRIALHEPRFDDDAVERVRGQMMSIIRSNQSDPGELASHTLFAHAFPDHPYSRPTDGTPESIAAMSVEDLRRIHRAAIVRDRAFIAIVGDVTSDEASEMVDRVMVGLPTSDTALPQNAADQLRGGVHTIDLPGGQSRALFGHAGIERDDPDFMAAYVMNHILGGGGFTSRLTEEVREKRGLTYGISTFLTSLDHGPLYLGSVASANETIAEALELVRSEWARMAREGVSEEELEQAKRFLTGAYPLRFDTNAKIADILAGVQEAELGIDYTHERNAMIEAITVEDIARVAERLLQPEHLTFIVVGQPQGLDTVSDPAQQDALLR